MGKAAREARVRLFKLYVSPDLCTWVIARNKTDAWKCVEDHEGEPRDNFADDYWCEVPSDEKLEIWCDPETEAPVPAGEDGAITITRTAAEWIAAEGRGWLCTTENP